MSPKVYVNKKGKFIMVQGKRVYLDSKLTKKELSGIYNLLLKKMKPKQKIKNTAKAIVNITNPKPQRRRRRPAQTRAQGSTIDPANRVVVSSTKPSIDRGLEDKLNNLQNQLGSLLITQKQEAPPAIVDYSQMPEQVRLAALQRDPLLQGQVLTKTQEQLAIKYGVLDRYLEFDEQRQQERLQKDLERQQREQIEREQQEQQELQKKEYEDEIHKYNSLQRELKKKAYEDELQKYNPLQRDLVDQREQEKQGETKRKIYEINRTKQNMDYFNMNSSRENNKSY